MAKTKPPQPEFQPVYEQKPDPSGRLRLDRPLTTSEAQAQDEEHRRILEENRNRRFEGRGEAA
jgi:hypothetical protein